MKIIDGKYGLSACMKEEIPQWVTKLGKVDEVVFYYDYQRDWIVLNMDHVNYKFNLMVARGYLELGNKERKEFADHVRTVRIETFQFLRCLSYVLRIRRNMCKRRTAQGRYLYLRNTQV